MFEQIYFGAAWYPELWDESSINEEIPLMQELGLNVIRVGEFAWSSLETAEGVYDFAWLDRVFNSLEAAGINVILGTPTATPPRWLTKLYPEVLHVTCDNVVMAHGGRQHVCLGNPIFHDYCKKIVKKLAKHFGQHANLVAWQIDNEPKGSGNEECFCPTCQAVFTDYLRKRYGSIETLNEAWGTKVWSQKYDFFEDIVPPQKVPAGHNPALTTAYSSYQHDQAAAFVAMQADWIREYSKLPVTTNSNPAHHLNHQKTFAPLDFVSFDEYPQSGDYRLMLFNYALWRGVGNNKKPFFLMETSPNHGGCIYGGYVGQNPEFNAVTALAGFAQGMQGYCYWLWRRQRAGMEMPHGALLNTWGGKSEGYLAAQKLGQSIKELSAKFLTLDRKNNQIAIFYSDEARSFWRTEPLNDIEYLREMKQVYYAIIDSGYNSDIVVDFDDISNYKILIVPYLPHLSVTKLEKLESWVANGGELILGPFTSFRTQEHTAYIDACLSRKVEEFCGVNVKYFCGLSGEEKFYYGAQLCHTRGLNFFFECIDANSFGDVDGGFPNKLSWFSQVSRQKGRVIFIGSKVDELSIILSKMINSCPALEQPLASVGTFAVENRLGNWLFAVNLDGKGGTLKNGAKIAAYQWLIQE